MPIMSNQRHAEVGSLPARSNKARAVELFERACTSQPRDAALHWSTLGYMHRLASSIAAAAVILALTGCTSPPIQLVCPAIAYSSAVSIQLSPATPGLSLALCSGAECTPGPVEGPVEVGSTAAPLATGVFGLHGASATGWTATLLDSPSLIGYQVSDVDGVILQEGILDVDWVRIDGSEQCGGNRHADLVIEL